MLSPQHEAVHTEPLDELYQVLAEVLTAEEPTHCHRSYLLVGDARPPHTQLIQGPVSLMWVQSLTSALWS